MSDLRVPVSHCAIGGPAAVVTSDPVATDEAVRVLRRGGSAVDALVAAAAVQCVVRNGSVSVAGMWISDAYDAATGAITTVTCKIGPAAAEPYDYTMDSPDAYGGRALPVPGWPAGAHLAWQRGGRLAWSEVLESAVRLAADGFDLDPATYLRVHTGALATRTAEGRRTWMPNGHHLNVGDRVVQPALARTLSALSQDGAAALYAGDFARDYVATSKALGGRLEMSDMARWPQRATADPARPLGAYRGCQVVTGGALLVYALHLAEAADIRSSDEAEAVYAQVRIMEEVFCATRDYSPATHDRFVDPAFARDRIRDVLEGPMRPTSLDQFWSNTDTLAVRDADGNMAWLVHSINTPQLFGAGIVVGGAYAPRAINARHAETGNLLAPGLFTTLALLRDGKPYLVAASPGESCVHAPLAFTTAVLERGLGPPAAIAAPRFALPGALSAGRAPFEGHYPPSVFALLEERGIPFFTTGLSSSHGRVTAMVVDGDQVHAVHDVRSEGAVAAFSG